MPLNNVRNILVGFTEEEERPSAALSYGLSMAREARAHSMLKDAPTPLYLSY